MTFGVDTVVIVYGVAVTGVVVFIRLKREPLFVLDVVIKFAVVGVPYVVDDVTTGSVGVVLTTVGLPPPPPPPLLMDNLLLC